MTATYEKIATTTLGSAQATVTFSSISGAYTDLVAICNFGGASAAEDFTIRFNGDTNNANYSSRRLYTDTSTIASDSPSDNTWLYSFINVTNSFRSCSFSTSYSSTSSLLSSTHPTPI